MAQALFAYRAQLPDGSETIRTGAAPQAPTHGQLADYAANRGEVFLGPVDMSPAPTSAATAAPPPRVAPGPVVPSDVAPTAGTAPTPAPVPAAPQGPLGRTFFPPRSFTSELPSVVGGTIASVTAGAAGLGPGAVPAAGFGAGLGEAAQIGAEQVMGWPPAEPGGFMERTGRAYARGATGEIVAAPVRWVVKGAIGAVKPLFKAVETLEPVLTAENPAPGTLAHWWQGAAKGGPGSVVRTWDDMGAAAQQTLAGDQHAAMSTVVDTLRGTGKPLSMMTPTQLATASAPAAAITHAGHPWIGTAVGLGTQLTREQAPRLLLQPTVTNFMARLPAVSRVASPFLDPLLRTGGQVVTGLEWPRTVTSD
jgi:hypothetical protein